MASIGSEENAVQEIGNKIFSVQLAEPLALPND